MTTVDQRGARRTRTGLIAHDPARALDGYTLFTPMFGDGTVYLIEVVHMWKLPNPSASTAICSTMGISSGPRDPAGRHLGPGACADAPPVRSQERLYAIVAADGR